MGPRDFKATLTSKALPEKDLCIKPQKRAGQSLLLGTAKLAAPTISLTFLTCSKFMTSSVQKSGSNSTLYLQLQHFKYKQQNPRV